MRGPTTKKVTKKASGNHPIPLERCLAKSRLSDDMKRMVGRTVLDHCCIVGEIAREIINRLPAYLQDSFFPKGSALIAACHDIGKVSPTFQKKIYSAIEDADDELISLLQNVDADNETNWGGHAGISKCVLYDANAGKFIPEIVGSHHGCEAVTGGRSVDAEQFGGSEWQQQRMILLNNLKNSMEESCFPELRSFLQARVLAGLTCVSDWIGSGSLFDDPYVSWKDIIPVAVDTAGFIFPELVKGLSFKDIFGFEARDIQKCLIEHAKQTGVYILEAPMGIGKTEAALYAAYSIVTSGIATGVYFALPTQMTSNRIHERVNQFLDRILEPRSMHRTSLLMHSSAWLKEFELGEEGNPGGSWFNSTKRGLLAPFAVGTIDQALMATMNVKHGFVRTFGLAGKVVILDEVHTYDSYTGTILDRLVDDLRKLHCTIIILSATLTNERRTRFLGTEQTHAAPYPLISGVFHGNNKPVVAAPGFDAGNNVRIRMIQDSNEALDEALERAEKGQQVLWIENTVAEAQKAFSILSARSEGGVVECGLLHSRFIQADRGRLEDYWVTRYGKGGSVFRCEHGRILVGTQVLEQSLDIDADFLITRVCPTDMLLQRIGRLWRHSLHQRPHGSVCEAWILSVDFEDAEQDPLKTFGKTARVYSPYVLLRTLQAWQGVVMLSLPGDIRPILEETYKSRQESEKMLEHKAALEYEKERLERLALVGVAMGVGCKSDQTASTRFSDIDTVDLLLLRDVRYNHAAGESEVTLLNGRRLTLPSRFPARLRKNQKELSAILATQTLRVSDYTSPEALSLTSLEWIRPYFYLGDKNYDESIFRVALVRDGGMLKSLTGGKASRLYELSYDPLLGYQYEKS